jgi:hypothetical protein
LREFANGLLVVNKMFGVRRCECDVRAAKDDPLLCMCTCRNAVLTLTNEVIVKGAIDLGLAIELCVGGSRLTLTFAGGGSTDCGKW